MTGSDEFDEIWEDDENDPDPDCCDHAEYEMDWMDRATCHRCGHSWYATAEQIRAQEQHEIDYARSIEEQQRHNNLWRVRFWRWLKGLSWPMREKDDMPF